MSGATTAGVVDTVPALRFPEFEGAAIQKTRFEDIFEFSGGKNIKQDEASPEFETPCVRYGELYHMYSEVISQVINRTNLDEADLHFSTGDEILLPSAGEDPWDIGSASALTVPNVAIGRTINILRPKLENQYSQIFASYYINTVLRVPIFKLARGSSISNVYNSDLKKLAIGLPSYNEQTKIAAFLGVVDAKLTALRERVALLERYKRGLMQALFSQSLRFTKPDGTAFPDWEEKRLGDYLQLSKIRVPSQTELPVYSSSRTGLKPQKDYFSDRELSNEGEYGVVPDGFITYRHMSDDLTFKFNLNNLGYDIVVSKEYPVFSTVNMDIRYLLAWLNNSPDFARFAVMQKMGGTRTRLYFKTLEKWKVFLPNPDEQQKIADALSAMDAKIAAVADQVARMEQFKKGLLQQMFV
ncbi:MAG: type I restriction enzyme S subunit [Parvibaculaceae bacterium]|jgi:type I restriction enzyme S subunit